VSDVVALATLESELIGLEFPSAEFTITSWEHWLCADAIGSPPLPDDIAHPMYGYYTAIIGMHPSLDEIFAYAHSSADAGVMFGEAGLEFHAPFRIGETYTVTGGFTAVDRKQSSRLGTMDLITFELQMHDADGNHVATSSNTFVYPRGLS
jgi:acyl dehydratase